MERRAQLGATLAQVAKWAAAFFAIGLGCLVTIGVIYRRVPPPGAVLAASALTFISTIAMGFASLSAFALRGVIEGRGRFSLRALLIATTIIAVGLAFIVWAARL